MSIIRSRPVLAAATVMGVLCIGGVAFAHDDGGSTTAGTDILRLATTSELTKAAPAVAPVEVVPVAAVAEAPKVEAAAVDADPSVWVGGIITSLTAPSFTMKTWDGSSIVVQTTDATSFTKSDGAPASFADLEVGDRVKVQGTQASDGTVSAAAVHIKDCDRFRDGDRDSFEGASVDGDDRDGDWDGDRDWSDGGDGDWDGDRHHRDGDRDGWDGDGR